MSKYSERRNQAQHRPQSKIRAADNQYKLASHSKIVHSQCKIISSDRRFLTTSKFVIYLTQFLITSRQVLAPRKVPVYGLPNAQARNRLAARWRRRITHAFGGLQ